MSVVSIDRLNVLLEEMRVSLIVMQSIPIVQDHSQLFGDILDLLATIELIQHKMME